MVKRSIFLVLFFCFIIICRAQEDEKIHWEVILPDNFSTLISDLNKNKEIIKKANVSQISYKSISFLITDSSKTLFDSSGNIISHIFWDDDNLPYKSYVNADNIYRINQAFINCNYGYDNNNRLNRVHWCYKTKDTINTIKKIYTYAIFYIDDSSNIIDKIDITDSLNISLGKVIFKYKNKMLSNEIGYWKGKKYYEKKHYYYYDKITKKLIKESVSLNKTIIKEVLYQENSKIYLKSYDDGMITETLSSYFEKSLQFEFSSYYINKYGNSEVIYDNRVYEYNIKGNLVTIYNILKLYKIPTMKKYIEIIYNTKGLIEKKNVYIGEDEYEYKYFYKYSY